MQTPQANTVQAQAAAMKMQAAEAAAKAAQDALLQQDAKAIAALDYDHPFSSLEDAVERLMPLHVRPPRAAGGLDAVMQQHPAVVEGCGQPPCPPPPPAAGGRWGRAHSDGATRCVHPGEAPPA
jgi:hypothetical protein